MIKIADVFVNIPVKSIAKPYTYLVPESLSFIDVGWRVLVPFGGRRVEGFVVAVREAAEAAEGLKAIDEPVDAEAWFSPVMIALAYWLAKYYLCSAGEAMRLFMPGKSGSRIRPVYAVNAARDAAGAALSPRRAAIYAWIAAHPQAEGAAVAGVFSEAAAADLRYLCERDWLVKTYRSERTAAIKTERRFVLRAPLSEAALAAFAGKPVQKKLLEELRAHGEQSAAALRAKGFSAHALQEVVRTGLVEIRLERLLRDSYRAARPPLQTPPALTDEQERAAQRLRAALDAGGFGAFLLHGITGSGKTQVYIEMVRHVRKSGRNAIVLVPEIGLTSQMIRQFRTYFPDEVIVMHSRLSVSERNDAIVKIRRGEAAIVIGARSALFTPVERVGAIILDEEHDPSYKQDESPRYHTRDVAHRLAQLHGAVLLLGSATPAVESYAAAASGTYELLTLTRRIGDTPLPLVKAVDMREELRLGRRNILSQALREMIAATLHRGEQIILMLNRRGYSTFVMCRECGHVISCRNCTLPLVYHKNGALQCHFCDTGEAAPDVCPKCGSRYIKYFGSGTERLEAELEKFFPTARTVRMDRDTTSGKLAHARILQDFAAGRYDILLGTQMVAKGHDIQNVTAVGIISADSSLNLPDFRAAERCFALITQAAGRAGRGAIRGRVIVQTYNPEHYAVTCGLQQDYGAFYQEEIALRKQLGYPPYSELIRVVVQNAEEAAAQVASHRLADLLRGRFAAPRHMVLGPAVAAVPQLRGAYRYTVLIQSQEIAAVKAFFRESGLYLKPELIIDVNPLQVL